MKLVETEQDNMFKNIAYVASLQSLREKKIIK